MSDPEVPRDEQPKNVDDVVGSANEGLDAAAAARDDIPGAEDPTLPADQDASAVDGADSTVDPDLAAFESAERDFPGTFGSPDTAAAPSAETSTAGTDDVVTESAAAPSDLEGPGADAAPLETTEHHATVHEPSVADTAYAVPAGSAAETQVVPAEPPVAPVAPPPQPIFVQAPEPPRDLGNRGAAGAIGLVATVAFAILYLGAILGLGLLSGDVTGDGIGDALLAPLTTRAFWVPVVVFFLAFWLLGVFVNRGRWGLWVIFGLLVGAATYGGHLLGQLFQAPFWRITASEQAELVNEQLLAPLAIAAFLFARELTVWFGAWAARSGARKRELNAEAQAEYERTLEAGPAALR